ncbi:MAG: hypothetical protein ACI8TP_003967 [Acidimicrobiales bacterium]
MSQDSGQGRPSLPAVTISGACSFGKEQAGVPEASASIITIPNDLLHPSMDGDVINLFRPWPITDAFPRCNSASGTRCRPSGRARKEFRVFLRISVGDAERCLTVWLALSPREC